ncbi:hypothetical protein HDU76_011898 [Blyttiomyces sp. JEL0837]|nr:hypothetical protein HDU76_011898 [Blyttiomyces sp. JEL0837]
MHPINNLLTLSALLATLSTTTSAQDIIYTREPGTFDEPVTVPMSRPPIKSLEAFKSARPRAWFKSFDSTNGTKLQLKETDKYHFTSKVVVGTTSFDLVLDTGSSDLWVRGPNCGPYTGSSLSNSGSDSSCSGPRLTLDNTTVPIKTTSGYDIKIEEVYGSADNPNTAIVMNPYNAPVTFAGNKVPMTVGVTYQEYGLPDSDGILGLGYDAISQIATEIQQSSVPSNVTSSLHTNYIDALPSSVQKIFGFYISGYGNGDNGEFTLGGFDTSRVVNDFKYVPVTEKGYWKIDIGSAQFSIGSASGSFGGSVSSAIVDSGAPAILVTDENAQAINEGLGATYSDQTGYTVDCKSVNSLPNFYLTLNGNVFIIPPYFYIIPVEYQGTLYCIPAFLGGAASNDLAIIGVPFLRAYYAVFDKVQNRIGFAQSNHRNLLPTFGGGSPTAINPTETNIPSSSPSSGPNKTIIYAGAGIGAFAVIVAVVVVVIRTRQIRQKRAAEAQEDAAYNAAAGQTGTNLAPGTAGGNKVDGAASGAAPGASGAGTAGMAGPASVLGGLSSSFQKFAASAGLSGSANPPQQQQQQQQMTSTGYPQMTSQPMQQGMYPQQQQQQPQMMQMAQPMQQPQVMPMQMQMPQPVVQQQPQVAGYMTQQRVVQGSYMGQQGYFIQQVQTPVVAPQVPVMAAPAMMGYSQPQPVMMQPQIQMQPQPQQAQPVMMMQPQPQSVMSQPVITTQPAFQQPQQQQQQQTQYASYPTATSAPAQSQQQYSSYTTPSSPVSSDSKKLVPPPRVTGGGGSGGGF